MKPLFIPPGTKTCTPDSAGAPMAPTPGAYRAIKDGSADFWAKRGIVRTASPWKKKRKAAP